MGNTYFYGKIVSMFGDNLLKGKKGTNKIMQYMMMSEMLKGGTDNNSMSAMMPLMLMSGNSMSDIFGGMFNFDCEDEDEDEETEESEDE